MVLTPIFPEDEAEVPLADRFVYPLEGYVKLGYSHLDVVRDRSGHPTGGHHIGIDFNAGEGDEDLGLPAALIGHGRCVSIIETPFGCGLGRVAIFEHRLPEGDTVYSRYAHLDTVEVSLGATYPLGARVGTIGRSGCQRSSHLHLDLGTDAIWQRTLCRRAWFYPDKAPPSWINRHFLDPRAFIEARMESELPLARSS